MTITTVGGPLINAMLILEVFADLLNNKIDLDSKGDYEEINGKEKPLAPQVDYLAGNKNEDLGKF